MSEELPLASECPRADTGGTSDTSQPVHLAKLCLNPPEQPLTPSLDDSSYGLLNTSLFENSPLPSPTLFPLVLTSVSLDSTSEEEPIGRHIYMSTNEYRLLSGDPTLTCPPFSRKGGQSVPLVFLYADGFSVLPPALDRLQRCVVDQLLQLIKELWPTRTSDADMCNKLLYSFANPLAFWHMVGEMRLKDLVARHQNGRNVVAGDAVQSVLNMIQQDLANDPFQPSLLYSVWSSIWDCLQGDEKKKLLSDELSTVPLESRLASEEMKIVYDAGRHYARTAIWIGFERCNNLDPLMHKHLVETNVLYQLGLQSEAFSKTDAVLLDLTKWDCICAPDASSTIKSKKYTLVFWEKTSRSDCKPSWSKVFGAIVHNLDVLHHHYLPENSTLVTTQMKAAVHYVYQQSSFDRHFPQGGVMVKSQGLQAKKALKCKMLNAVGQPETSSFATFAYCAGTHLDNDESASHGWVMERPKNMSRFQSNFVFPGFCLLVELSQGAHWFWHADKDEHGMTTNVVAAGDPGHWKAYATKGGVGQWTLVDTIPHAVAEAAVST
ncbi:hypothetical protein JAAARDRAFT_194877 [Jaapia argillacea MUCL 33604]|uniref:Uncharacterized protein n=1 Tax=Jaapia argillacea MUCL 33604 TaxID=933084 RepID=A0A067PY52_9AGAM|nr:hypothetical protein JAAARDRAFT_194877 [Jaapia argillacea MUCL 33604]